MHDGRNPAPARRIPPQTLPHSMARRPGPDPARSPTDWKKKCDKPFNTGTKLPISPFIGICKISRSTQSFFKISFTIRSRQTMQRQVPLRPCSGVRFHNFMLILHLFLQSHPAFSQCSANGDLLSPKRSLFGT